MAFRKTLVHRLLDISKPSSISKSLIPNTSRCHDSAAAPPSFLHRLLLRSDSAVLRRFLHQVPALPPDRRLALPVRDKLIERIRSLNGERIRLDALSPPAPPDREMTVEETRKVLRVSQMEAVRARLRDVPESTIPHVRFVAICGEVTGERQGAGVARALDESGAVLVLGNVVFLRPEQVARAISSVIPLSAGITVSEDDPRLSELRELDERKASIDARAAAGVRRELWFGLAYMVAQTAAFARLTFWELSWDVMEPICFYVTSVYCMAGYAFFLRTSRDPSFEGFFESRFAARQRRIMRAEGFDLRRLHELRRALGVHRPKTKATACVDFHSCPSDLGNSHNGPRSYCECHREVGFIGLVH